jgi:hypothetical protein
MRLRLPRLRRHGGTTPPYRPGSDEVLVRLSPGTVHCTRCGSAHEGVLPDPETVAWLMGHDCTEDPT